MDDPQELRAPSLGKLALLGLPAMAAEVAPYVCISVQTGLLAHSSARFGLSAVQVVAGFAAVNSTLDFIASLFNFLFMVVLANVGRAVGRRDWVEVGRRVSLALAAAVVLGVAAAAAALSLRPAVFSLLHGES